MVQINSIHITPPLLNSSCAWSSDLAQLRALYDSPYTGAITTRTATPNGYNENDSHTFAFTNATISSINSYGITSDIDDPTSLASMVNQLQDLRKKLADQEDNGNARVAIELNTSCPNIKDSPPPGYDFESLSPLLQVLREAYTEDPTLTIGLKLPPLVHEQQFHSILNRIKSLTPEGQYHSAAPSDPTTSATSPFISFLTCTNTLGNTLLFSDQSISATFSPFPSNVDSTSMANYALPTVLGGLAGEALHPLALGNVYQFSRILKESDRDWLSLSEIKIIGVGGVTSKKARERMTKAGADAVACATLFGKEGVMAFEILSQD